MVNIGNTCVQIYREKREEKLKMTFQREKQIARKSVPQGEKKKKSLLVYFETAKTLTLK